MADVNVDINLRTKYDGKGAADAKSDTSAVKGHADAAAGAFGRVRNGVNGVARAVETLNKIMALGGILAIVMSAVNAFRAWKEKVDEVNKSHEELKRAIGEIDHKEGIDAVTDSYAKLASAMTKAAREQQNVNAAIEDAVNAVREQVDAESRLAEARAIGAVSKDDPNRESKIDAIRREYQFNRADDAAGQKKQDAIDKAASLEDEAKAETANAQGLKAIAADLERKLIEAEAAATSNKRDAEGDNYADKAARRAVTTVMQSSAGAFVQTSYVDDPTAPKIRTKEGDDIRKERLGEYQKSQAEADGLRAKLEQVTQQIDALLGSAVTKEVQAEGIRTDSASLEKTERALSAQLRANAELEAAAKKQKEAAAETERVAKERASEVQKELDKVNGQREEIVKKEASAPSGNLEVSDRISNLGGFASAAAAAVTGVGIRPQENPELQRLENLAGKLLIQLESINKNTKDNVGTIG